MLYGDAGRFDGGERFDGGQPGRFPDGRYPPYPISAAHQAMDVPMPPISHGIGVGPR